MLALRRTSIADLRPSLRLCFGKDDGPDVDDLTRELIPLDAMPLEPPELQLSNADDARRFAAGVAQETDAAPGDGFCTVLDSERHLLGVGEVLSGRVQPRVVLVSRVD
jgi:hypothetical protein